MRRPAAFVAVLGLAGALAPASSGAPAATHTVTLKNIAFHSKRLAIARGDTVRWVWHDGVAAHNVTSKGKPRFKASSTKNKGTYSIRFTKPGTYRYRCTIHFGMDGTIVVR